MAGAAAHLHAVSTFLKQDVWQDPPDAGRVKMLALYFLRSILITVNGLQNKMILLRASALSYSTLLAIVPALAIGFSMMKGMGFQTRIEHILINYLTAQQEELTRHIIGYITNTDFKALGAFGTIILIYAVIMMLGNVEQTFNELWGVTRSRRMVRKITDYISVLILGPLLIVLSTAMLTSLSSNTVVQHIFHHHLLRNAFTLFNTAVPHAMLWLAFTAMYILMPNTRVKFIPALIAGIVCGSIWEGAFRVYTEFNIGVARYNKIYGTFAVLPIFIIWLYISWIIVLLGAQLSNAIQHVKSYQQEFTNTTVSIREKESIAVYIMLRIADRFHRGLPPLSAEELSHALALPVRITRNLLKRLSDCQILQEIYGDDQTFQPAKDLGLIRISDIYYAIHQADQSDWQVPADIQNPGFEKLISEIRNRTQRDMDAVTLLDLISGSEIACGRKP